MAVIGAIEAGGTKFNLAVAAADGTVLARERLATETAAITMPRVRDWFLHQAEQTGGLAAIGIGSFGPIDVNPASPRYGTITTTPKPGWRDADLRAWLAPLGVPLRIDTDVNAAALAEWRNGAGRSCDTVAYTTVGTGIGTGIVHRGTALAGFSHYESGHIRVPHDRTADPFAGTCPYHGDCLEGLAAGPAIAARFGASLGDLADAAPAIGLVAGYLADLAVNLVLLHAPDRLIFGGGVMKAPGLHEELRRQTAARLAGYIAHPRLGHDLEGYIAAPALGDDAGISGAFELARTAIAHPVPAH